MARFYGFGHGLSTQQSWTQTSVLLLVFIGMAVPLAISLGRIGREAVATTQIRTLLSESFGADARVTQLDVDFDAVPLSIRSVVIAPQARAKDSATIEAGLARKLGRAVHLQLDEVLLDPAAGSAGAQRAELDQTSAAADAETAATAAVARLVALAAGVPPDAVTIDRDHRRATATAAALPGASPEAYRALESRTAAAAPGWRIAIVPPLGTLPHVRFADDVDTLDPDARSAVLLSAWEAQRWNITALAVPGLPAGTPPAHPSLNQRRGLAVAALLRQQGIKAVAAPAAGQDWPLAASLTGGAVSLTRTALSMMQVGL